MQRGRRYDSSVHITDQRKHPGSIMNKSSIDAIIFDMDGVITNSTPLHSQAWKEMFDQFLKVQAKKTSIPFQEFTHEGDYLKYVDGKPRYIGVKSFLESRGVDLPFGDPSQKPGQDSICALGDKGTWMAI